MTVGELREIFEKDPMMIDIVHACIVAEEADPVGFSQAVPIILKVMQDMRKAREGKTWQS